MLGIAVVACVCTALVFVSLAYLRRAERVAARVQSCGQVIDVDLEHEPGARTVRLTLHTHGPISPVVEVDERVAAIVSNALLVAASRLVAR